ncbi:MAG: response regulator, partial [Gammaproteobacteria bacterium]|nr:response regulator [Gammaproteobacteria bacterium]
MSIRVLVIESSKDYRALIAHHIGARWRDAKVTEYDPAESGRFSENFSGANNDLVILGDPLGDQCGLDWLAQFRQTKGFPPVIVVGDGEERAIVRAMKLGAADYLSRSRLKHD